MSQPASSNQPKLESVPAAWPGAFGAYKYSRDAVLTNIGTLILGGLAALAVAIVYGILSGILNLPGAFDNLVQTALNIYVALVEILILFAGIDRAKITLGGAIEKSKPFIGQWILLCVLLALIAFGSFVLLIVPFFFIMPRVSLAPYYLTRKGMGATDALRASWEQTQGNVAKVYGMVGVNVLIVLLALTIIGIPFAIYFGIMYAAVFNVFFAHLTEHGKSAKATS